MDTSASSASIRIIWGDYFKKRPESCDPNREYCQKASPIGSGCATAKENQTFSSLQRFYIDCTFNLWHRSTPLNVKCMVPVPLTWIVSSFIFMVVVWPGIILSWADKSCLKHPSCWRLKLQIPHRWQGWPQSSAIVCSLMDDASFTMLASSSYTLVLTDDGGKKWTVIINTTAHYNY